MFPLKTIRGAISLLFPQAQSVYSMLRFAWLGYFSHTSFVSVVFLEKLVQAFPGWEVYFLLWDGPASPKQHPHFQLLDIFPCTKATGLYRIYFFWVYLRHRRQTVDMKCSVAQLICSSNHTDLFNNNLSARNIVNYGSIVCVPTKNINIFHNLTSSSVCSCSCFGSVRPQFIGLNHFSNT